MIFWWYSILTTIHFQQLPCLCLPSAGCSEWRVSDENGKQLHMIEVTTEQETVYITSINGGKCGHIYDNWLYCMYAWIGFSQSSSVITPCVHVQTGLSNQPVCLCVRQPLTFGSYSKSSILRVFFPPLAYGELSFPVFYFWTCLQPHSSHAFSPPTQPGNEAGDMSHSQSVFSIHISFVDYFSSSVHRRVSLQK